MSTEDAITEAVAKMGKFLAKTSQATLIKEIGDGKRATLHQLVNIFAENK